MRFPDIPTRIVAAPMAGGPTTARLVAAVGEAGGLGMLAAGYKTADAVRAEIEAVRASTGKPFGVNVFVATIPSDDPRIGAYRDALRERAARWGVEPGPARHTDGRPAVIYQSCHDGLSGHRVEVPVDIRAEGPRRTRSS